MSFIRKKLVVIGDRECGKTSLCSMFSNETFPKNDISSVNVYISEMFVKLAVWDGPGHENYDRLRPLQYPYTDVAIIVYSIDSPDSLYNIKERWVREVDHFCPGVPIVLVGNKVDLRDDTSTIKHLKKYLRKPVSYGEGKKMAHSIGAYAFFECSALDNLNVKEAFFEATKATIYSKTSQKKKCAIL